MGPNRRLNALADNYGGGQAQSGSMDDIILQEMMARSGQQYIPNKFIETRREAQEWQDQTPFGLAEFLAAMGVTALAPNPVTGAAAVGLGIDGGRRVLQGAVGRNVDKRLRYQGN